MDHDSLLEAVEGDLTGAYLRTVMGCPSPWSLRARGHGRCQEGVTAPVRQLIALGHGGDSRGFEVPRDPIAGRVSQMRALEQRCELARGMPGQQYEYAGVSALSGEPVADHLPRGIPIRSEDREGRAQPQIEHRDGRLVRIQQSKASTLGIGVDLSGEERQILPAVYHREHQD